jgi:translation initiation factor 1A
MPNMKGGKGYKRGARGDDEEKMIEWDEKQGVMLGRVIKVLGSRRFSVYCNDSLTRICRIRGSMRKSDWINVGAIVLIAARTFDEQDQDSSDIIDKGKEIGDIMHLFGPSMYRDLKNMPTTNSRLFTLVENHDDKYPKKVEDDLFLDEGEEEDEEEGETAAEKNARNAEKDAEDAAEFNKKAKARAQELTSKRAAKDMDREISLHEL